MSLIRFSTSVACVGVAVLLIAFSTDFGCGARSRRATPCRLAVDYLLASQQPSGFLRYGFDFLSNAAAEPGAMSAVQLTRQAGTAAVLADYYALTRDPRAAVACRRLLASV